jgi:hypothetical protein
MTLRTFFLLLLLVCWPLTTQAQSPPQEFQQARNVYRAGNYSRAIQLFKRLLYPKPGRLRDPLLRKKAQTILGVCYFYLYAKIDEQIDELQRKKQSVPAQLPRQRKRYLRQARYEFLNLLSEHPGTRLNVLLYTPDHVNYFNRLRKINEQRIKAALKRQKRRKQLRVKVVKEHIETQIHQTPLVVTFLPCGVPQYYNGHYGKGIAISVGCALSVGTYFATFLWLTQLQGNLPNTFTKDNFALAQQLQIIHITSLGVLGAVMLYGYIDGFVYYRPRRTSLIPHLPKLIPDGKGFAQRFQ